MGRDPALGAMLAALAAATLLAALSLALFGAGARGADIALQLTARLAFFPFLLAYVAAPLAQLFGPRLHALRRQARTFGLAFAAAECIHLFVVAWLCWIGHAPPLATFLIFGIAAAWVALLAMLSFMPVPRGSWLWWSASRIGMNYVALAFLLDFLSAPLFRGAKGILFYLPFALLNAAAIALQFAPISTLFPRAALPLRVSPAGRKQSPSG